MSHAGVELHEQFLDWQRPYQFGMPLPEELMLHKELPYMSHHQQQDLIHAYGPSIYQNADPFWQQRSQRSDTQPWQQPPDPPDWQRHPESRPFINKPDPHGQPLYFNTGPHFRQTGYPVYPLLPEPAPPYSQTLSAPSEDPYLGYADPSVNEQQSFTSKEVSVPRFRSTCYEPRYTDDQPPRPLLSLDQYEQPLRVTHQLNTLQQPVRTELPAYWDPPPVQQPNSWGPLASFSDQLDWQKAYQPYTQPPHADQELYVFQQPPSVELMSHPNLGLGRIESLGKPPTTDADRDLEMPQLSEGTRRDPTAAMLEQIPETMARIEARLDEADRRAAATQLPPRPEPDPPNEMPRGKGNSAMTAGVSRPFSSTSRMENLGLPRTTAATNDQDIQPWEEVNLLSSVNAKYDHLSTAIQKREFRIDSTDRRVADLQPPDPILPFCWHSLSCHRSPTTLLPAPAAAPPHADALRYPSHLHFPTSMEKVILNLNHDFLYFKLWESTFQSDICFGKLKSSTENMCSVGITFDENVTNLGKESERFSSCREIIVVHEIHKVDTSFHSFCDSKMRHSNISTTSVVKSSVGMLHGEIKKAYSCNCTAVSEFPPPSPLSPIFLPVIEGDFKVVLLRTAHVEVEIYLESVDPSIQEFVGRHLIYLIVGYGGRVQLARNYQEGWDASVSQNFKDNGGMDPIELQARELEVCSVAKKLSNGAAFAQISLAKMINSVGAIKQVELRVRRCGTLGASLPEKIMENNVGEHEFDFGEHLKLLTLGLLIPGEGEEWSKGRHSTIGVCTRLRSCAFDRGADTSQSLLFVDSWFPP